jgi:cyclophilin family peptidyl-prolyl cis-trans isomerase
MTYSRRTFVHLLTALGLTMSMQTAGAADNPQVTLTTSMGNVVMELYPEKAPKTVENFLKYVKSGHYSGTIFHRVIPDFMVQGGGFDKDMKQKPTGSTVENEAKNGLKNEAYTVAMARTSDPHSASAQFFINVKENSFLNYPGRDGWGYTVFGKIIQGTEVIDKMKSVDTTNSGMHRNVPTKPIVIESASITK